MKDSKFVWSRLRVLQGSKKAAALHPELNSANDINDYFVYYIILPYKYQKQYNEGLLLLDLSI